jgi:hypothetical protein
MVYYRLDLYKDGSQDRTKFKTDFFASEKTVYDLLSPTILKNSFFMKYSVERLTFCFEFSFCK